MGHTPLTVLLALGYVNDSSLWTSWQIRKIGGYACAGNVSLPPQVSNPNMHHSTCMTHVSWRMLGSLISGFLWSWWWGNVPGIPDACATRNFTYLVRGPWCEQFEQSRLFPLNMDHPLQWCYIRIRRQNYEHPVCLFNRLLSYQQLSTGFMCRGISRWTNVPAKVASSAENVFMKQSRTCNILHAESWELCMPPLLPIVYMCSYAVAGYFFFQIFIFLLTITIFDFICSIFQRLIPWESSKIFDRLIP